MSAINDADYAIVKAATELGKDETWRDPLIYGVAELLPFFFLAAAVLIFLSGKTKRQKEKAQDTAMAMIVALLLAVGLTWILHEVWIRERPFVTHQIHHLKLVSPEDSSLPSGHALMLFAVAGTVAFIGNFPRWAKLLLFLAVLVAVARVFAGVHYVTDIALGAALGLGLAKLVSWQSRAISDDMR